MTACATRVTLLRLAGCAWLVACSDGLEGPWTPKLRSELTAHDSAVYSAWLAARTAGSGLVLVDGRTTGTTYPGLSLISPAPVVCLPTPIPIAQPPVIVPPPPPPPPPPPVPTPATACGVAAPRPGPAGDSLPSHKEAAQDQRVQQQLSLPLEPRLTGASYQLVHDPVPESLLQRARAVLAFSRAGFDRRLQVAVFQVLQAPVGAGGAVGPAAEYTVVAERSGSRWEVSEVYQAPPDLVGMQEPAVGTPPVAICDSVRTTNCTRIPGPVPLPLPLPRPK